MIQIAKMVNHVLTEEQLCDLKGYEIIELPNSIQDRLKNCPDTEWELGILAKDVLKFLEENQIYRVLSPAGSPAFCAIFSRLCYTHITQIFSHSVREFTEEMLSDGSIKKTNIFKHKRYLFI